MDDGRTNQLTLDRHLDFMSSDYTVKQGKLELEQGFEISCSKM